MSAQPAYKKGDWVQFAAANQNFFAGKITSKAIWKNHPRPADWTYSVSVRIKLTSEATYDEEGNLVRGFRQFTFEHVLLTTCSSRPMYGVC